MSELYNSIPQQQIDMYMQHANEAVTAATEPVLRELGHGALMEAGVVLQSQDLADKAAQYVQDNDLMAQMRSELDGPFGDVNAGSGSDSHMWERTVPLGTLNDHTVANTRHRFNAETGKHEFRGADDNWYTASAIRKAHRNNSTRSLSRPSFFKRRNDT